MNNFSEKVSLIWSVADLLRGDYKPSEYGRVMLPFLVLRRLDQVLASTRKAVLEADSKFPADKVPEALRERMLLKASGETFYNTSKLDFTAMLDDANNAAANLSGYVHGFSKNVRDIMEKGGVPARDFDTPSLVSSPCASTSLPQDRRRTHPIHRFQLVLTHHTPTNGAVEPAFFMQTADTSERIARVNS